MLLELPIPAFIASQSEPQVSMGLKQKLELESMAISSLTNEYEH